MNLGAQLENFQCSPKEELVRIRGCLEGYCASLQALAPSHLLSRVHTLIRFGVRSQGHSLSTDCLTLRRLIYAGVAQIHEGKSLRHAIEKRSTYSATGIFCYCSSLPTRLQNPSTFSTSSRASRGFAVRTTDLKSALARRSV